MIFLNISLNHKIKYVRSVFVQPLFRRVKVNCFHFQLVFVSMLYFLWVLSEINIQHRI